jgi:hypothetical protein
VNGDGYDEESIGRRPVATKLFEMIFERNAVGAFHTETVGSCCAAAKTEGQQSKKDKPPR